MSYLRLRHVFTTSASNIAVGLVSLALTVLVARSLTPQENGYYSEFLLIFNLYYFFFNFGMGPSFTYYLSSGKLEFTDLIR